MVRKSVYLWILSPLALLWPISAVAVGQDVSSGSPVAMSYAADMAPAPDVRAPMTPMTSASPMAPAPMAPSAGMAPAAGCTGCATGDCGSGSGGCDCCRLNCPDQNVQRLFGDNCWLKCHDITVQGFIESGYSWHDGQRNPDGFNGPDGFNDRDQELQLNQVYTRIQKALKDNDCCWDWGFTIDTLTGSDYRYPLAKGLDAYDNGSPKWNFDSRNFYGLALPQAYLEFGTSTLSYKIGHFYTLLGNEVTPATGNVFYSHSYMFLYAYPFTHTGALATYKPNDQLTLVTGIDEGWDNFDDTDSNPGYTGQAIFSTKDKHTTLNYAWHFSNEPIVSGGNPGGDPNAREGRFVNSLVLSHDLNDRLSYVLENGDGFQSNGKPGGGTASWYGLDSYLLYKVNCCWTAATRIEWFRDTEGTRVAPVGDFDTPNGNVASAGGFAGSFYDVTCGLNYHPNGNLQIRPEIRYDWFDGNALNGVSPYHDGAANHQWISSVDVIWQY